MPEICISLEIPPLALVGRWNCDADIAAEWLTARVTERTFLAAIELGDRGMKPLIQRMDLGRLQIVSGFENPVWPWGHDIHSNKKHVEGGSNVWLCAVAYRGATSRREALGCK